MHEKAPVAVLLDAAYAAYAPKGSTCPHGARVAARARPGARRLERLEDLDAIWPACRRARRARPDAGERSRIQAALSYAWRGTWSNCNRGGMLAVARLLGEPALAEEVRRERKVLVDRLSHRVDLFNRDARARGLRYPRYDGGFFVTIFDDDAFAAAEKMRRDGVFVVPQKGALRVALCAVAETDIGRLVDSLAKACT